MPYPSRVEHEASRKVAPLARGPSLCNVVLTTQHHLTCSTPDVRDNDTSQLMVMASRYVPPHLRGDTASKSPVEASPIHTKPRRRSTFSDDPNLHSAEEIKNHFWPSMSNDGLDAGGFPTDPGHSKTLHDSAATPGKLAYLFLFKDANPRWESDGIVFTKSSLELLPDASEEERPDAKSKPVSPAATAAPNGAVRSESSTRDEPAITGQTPYVPTKHIAIFKQHHRGHRSFSFEGWYSIARLTYLDPQTPELVRMLEQKWTRIDRFGKVVKRERDPGAWQASLSMRWAVVKFEKIIDGPEAPKIERIEREESKEAREARREERKKSVNEMLAEMRSGGGGEVEEVVDQEATDHVASDWKDEDVDKDPSIAVLEENTISPKHF